MEIKCSNHASCAFSDDREYGGFQIPIQSCQHTQETNPPFQPHVSTFPVQDEKKITDY